jgi:hypothetical protein
VIEQGTNKGFCVSGETLQQAFVMAFKNVRGFLSAHAQECSKTNTVSNWFNHFLP